MKATRLRRTAAPLASVTLCAVITQGRAPHALSQLTGRVILHDPSRIYEESGRYYLFHTGDGVGSKFSDDLVHWRNGLRVFDATPTWADDEVSGNTDSMWAPDVFRYGDEYRLYYSLSSFGSQDSVIGLATNTTLDFNDPAYQWVDQGLVIESERFSPFNAIDPGVFFDELTSRMWLAFGSHWNGVYITELDPATGKRLSPSSPTLNIARNPSSPVNAIEAPYLMERDGYYYLFVNWDACCQGENSTYNIRVGRGMSPTGPFRDRDGVAMTSGGGELFLGTEANYIGPGHFSEFDDGGVEYFSYHYYDGNADGASKLNIEPLAWTVDGWPIPASDLAPGDFNGDGVVDGEDLGVWKDYYGEKLSGDDFLVWQRSANPPVVTRASNETIPEPSAATLCGFIVFLCARHTIGCSSGLRPGVASIMTGPVLGRDRPPGGARG